MADADVGNLRKESNEVETNKVAKENFILEGTLKKQGKFSTKWYHCFAKLEKDCFVYKRHDKVKMFDIIFFYNLFDV